MIFARNECFGLFAKIKMRLASGEHFMYDFFVKMFLV